MLNPLSSLLEFNSTSAWIAVCFHLHILFLWDLELSIGPWFLPCLLSPLSHGREVDHLFCRLEVGTFWSKPQNLSVFASSVIASQTDFKCQVWITLCSVYTCCPQRSTLS